MNLNQLINSYHRPGLFIILILLTGCINHNESTDEEYFTIAVLPDTQYYTALKHGGTMEMFEDQIDWILDNYEKENIKYVVHLGDLVDHGEQEFIEWERGKEEMYKLETPLPGLPDGIPYGIAVGNHDQEPLRNVGKGGTDKGYNKYFNRERFEERSYYGGAFGDNNDNHFDLFEAGDSKFLVLYLEYNEDINEYYDPEIEKDVFDWAENVLRKYGDHKAIIVSHSLLARPEESESNIIGGSGNNTVQGEFTKQGAMVYEQFKRSPNVFLMLCGHRSGEAIRTDRYDGHTIKTYLCDYQSRTNGDGDRNGGNGLMRLMKFDIKDSTMQIKTFAPRKNGMDIIEADEDSKFTMPLYQ